MSNVDGSYFLPWFVIERLGIDDHLVQFDALGLLGSVGYLLLLAS